MAVARIIAQVTGIAVVNERNINNCQREDFTSLRASLKPLLLTDSNRFAGTERHMLDLARALADAGVQVSIGCPTNAPLERRCAEYQLKTLSVPECGFFFGAVAKLAKALARGDVNIIHAHNGVSHAAAVLAIAIAGKGICIVTQHFVSPARTGRTGWLAVLSEALHRWNSRHTNRFIAVSNAVAETCKVIYRCKMEDLFVIPNGIFPLSDCEIRCETARQEFGLGDEIPIVVSVSRLAPEKDLDVLINAMAHVQKSFPDCQCLIAGEGELEPELRKLISKLGLTNVVKLVGFLDNPSTLIAASNVFVLPCHCEGFGLVLLEAMSLERPVIAARSGGPLEVIESSVSGRFFEPHNPIDLAKNIQEILASKSEAQRLASAGHERYLSNFTAEQMAASTLKVYSSAMQANPTGSN